MDKLIYTNISMTHKYAFSSPSCVITHPSSRITEHAWSASFVM